MSSRPELALISLPELHAFPTPTSPIAGLRVERVGFKAQSLRGLKMGLAAQVCKGLPQTPAQLPDLGDFAWAPDCLIQGTFPGKQYV